MSVPIEDQIKCLAREIRLRENCYPKWVASGRMKQAEADKELAAMKACLETVKGKQNG